MSVFLISDLHLDQEKPKLSQIFFNFVKNYGLEADAVYLLGDIFEVWIGDDDRNRLSVDVLLSLHAMVSNGVKVYFMHGNRDFMVAEKFATDCGLTLLEDPCVHTIGGVPTLLSHGDLYCTDDIRYQAFRAKSRTPEWQHRMLRLPLFVRRAIARYGRAKSKKHHARQGMTIISDVVEADIIAAMEQAGVKRMIHGHTHRPDVHTLTLKDGAAERIVLADWRETGEALEILADGTYRRIALH